MLRNLVGEVRNRWSRMTDTPPRFVLERMPKRSVCAEIGVWKGDFSREIVKVVDPEELHLIDPWEFQEAFPKRMYGGKRARGQADMDAIYEAVRAELSKRPGVRLHRGYSDEVLASFEDGYFDWVYIDGNHYYDYVRKDLELSWAKVKPGGFITGDDYNWTPEDGGSSDHPVERAVSELMEAKGLRGDALSVRGRQFILQRP